MASQGTNYLIALFFVVFPCFLRTARTDTRGVQEPIPDLEKALGMAAILLSGDIEEEIVKLQSRKTGSLPVTFENVYAELDHGEIILLKPTLKYLPQPIFHLRELNLEKNYLTISAEWKNVTVCASYESYTERDLAPPLRIDGQLSFRWNSIKAFGAIGLCAVGDHLKVTNNDFKYEFEAMILDIVDHRSEHVTTDAVISSCQNIASKLYWDLRWELKSSLEKSLNHFLKAFTLSDSFNSLAGVRHYRATTRNLTNQANRFIDEFLKVFRETIRAKGMRTVPLRDIEKSVDAKLGIVSLHGNFSALKGSAGDLSSIERVGDFSIWTPNNSSNIQLTGYIRFADFSASYEHYEAMAVNIKVIGNLHASSTTNLLAMKMLLVPDTKSSFGYSVRVDKIEAVRVGHIAVKVTGIGPLNNFVSLIATMVLNHFKSNIFEEMNKIKQFTAAMQAVYPQGNLDILEYCTLIE